MGRSAKAAAQKKKDKAQTKKGTPNSSAEDLSERMSTLSTNSNGSFPSVIAGTNEVSKEEDLNRHIARTCTGVLASVATAKDVKIEQFSLQFHGKKLIENTNIELTMGRRYGLLGANGSGKSTFLQALAAREVPIPEHIDIFLLNEEFHKTEMTAVEAVVDEAKRELQRLEEQVDLIVETEGPESPLVEDLYDRIERMDADTFEARVSQILSGLGFTQEMMAKKTKDMSGGWRMRVSLAKALFNRPTLLLLDEPTNHLDLEACVWLENYLKHYDRILVLISHSQDFLNNVCTNIMNLQRGKLVYYSGNYDQYVKTREEQETNQMKMYNKQQEEIAHIKKFIASCGTYANLVRQAKSRQKILDKMEADGLIEKVVKDHVFTFRFNDPEKLPPPVLSFDDVAFAYDGNIEHALYKHLELAIDTDSRIALVGPNGVGKSTLLKLMLNELTPTAGRISRHMSLKLAQYNQHSTEILPMEKNVLDFMREKYAHLNHEFDWWRQQLGKFGVSGPMQTAKMGTLSDGQRSRIVFAVIAYENPHIILLDEPTNHLDMECIDSLADAINNFQGGMVLVSHDFRLINQVAQEIWVVDNKCVTKWKGDIQDYKTSLKKKMNLMD
jgi:ATP-binding cassette subfamily F protein 2